MINATMGTIIDTGEKFKIDLETLLNTRLLVQANSGGGKSYLLRKLLEESLEKKVQVIVLDIEGEFSTLREEFDILVFGEGGDAPAHPKTANILARKILELKVSAIINLYELKKHERILFVKNFLESMIDSPKKLWHPCLVFIDEAHSLSPEKGKCEASGAVIDLCTRGRKRGFAVCLATQRLSKLNKDAAAECLCKLIGRTGLDVDMKRAYDELGFTTKAQYLSLRDLEPGEFYAFGPAISKRVITVKVGNVKTTHPTVGTEYIDAVPAPTSKIKKMIESLGDIQKEAEEELKTTQDFKKKIHELKLELRRQRMESKSPQIDENALQKAEAIGFRKAERQFTEANKIMDQRHKKIAMQMNKAKDSLLKTAEHLDIDISEIPKPKIKMELPRAVLPSVPSKIYKKEVDGPYNNQIDVDSGDLPLGKCEQAIINALNMFHPEETTKKKLSIFTGYSIKSGGFNNSIYKLSKRGLIKRTGTNMLLTEEGVENVTEGGIPEDRLSFWLGRLGKAPSAILKELADRYPDTMDKEEIAEATGYSITSGGFNNSIYKLNTLQLIERDEKEIKAADDLFD